VHCRSQKQLFLAEDHRPPEEACLSKAALARQIGVNVNNLWRLEQGDRTPNGLHLTLYLELIRKAN
jgi:DNA-binding transcriptional regulator YiaG